ncbi:hypothetical protein EJ110_NYTH35605 [Nymphaea thermarum]|nr:hypothetical protein EJ110_NYTH35605 [Nymphaea thermarum]
MLINEKLSCSAADSTIIRMPLSLQCMSEGLESGSKRIMGIFENFIAHASSSLLFLKSVLEHWHKPEMLKPFDNIGSMSTFIAITITEAGLMRIPNHVNHEQLHGLPFSTICQQIVELVSQVNCSE